MRYCVRSSAPLLDWNRSETTHASVAGVGSGHHVARVEHLLRQFGDGDGAERLGARRGEGGVSDHEEVETGEGDHVDGELAEVRVELSGELRAIRASAPGAKARREERTRRQVVIPLMTTETRWLRSP